MFRNPDGHIFDTPEMNMAYFRRSYVFVLFSIYALYKLYPQPYPLHTAYDHKHGPHPHRLYVGHHFLPDIR